MIMKSFSAFLREARAKSKAVLQADRMGLKSDGHGGWYNDRGEFVAKTEGGKLTFFNDSKGYGFIRDSETQDSVFVHINEFQDDIMEGNVVSFEVEKGLKGPAAVRVKLAK